MTRAYYTRVVASSLVIVGSIVAIVLSADGDAAVVMGISVMYYVVGLLVAFPAADEARR